MAGDPLISTRDHPGEYDALVSAKPGEPIFVVQGGDPFGPATVFAWAKSAREAGLAEADQPKADTLLRKATNAEQVAWRMQAYQKGEQEQEGVRARYQDTPPPPVADGADERAVRIRVAGRASHLTSEAMELADGLEAVAQNSITKIGLGLLRDAAQTLKSATAMIEPRVGRERT